MKINYIKFGTGEKTMLILPGIGIKPVCIAPDPVIEAYKTFTDEFTVYLFDPRNDLPEVYDIETMAEDVYGKIEELDLKDIYLYGVSMGGMVAMALTAAHPQLIKKLVLCSSVHKGNEIFDKWYEFAKAKDSYRLVDSFMDSVYSKDFNDRYKEAAMVAFREISDDEFRRFAILDDALRKCDMTHLLEELKDKDILLIGSRIDKVFSYEDMKDLAETIGCETYFYDGCGHAIYDEMPDIKERIKEFYLR